MSDFLPFSFRQISEPLDDCFGGCEQISVGLEQIFGGFLQT
jgi:hypothetical protein